MMQAWKGAAVALCILSVIFEMPYGIVAALAILLLVEAWITVRWIFPERFTVRHLLVVMTTIALACALAEFNLKIKRGFNPRKSDAPSSSPAKVPTQP